MKVCEDGVAVWWEGPLAIDADGSPFAYAPPAKERLPFTEPGLDYLANAGEDGDWYGLVTDRSGKPIKQSPDGPSPNPGGYLSPTALQDRSKPISDPARYVDSGTVRYVSAPRDAFRARGLALGDVALAYCRRTGQLAAAIVADAGPKGKYGEASMATAEAIGVPNSPKNGGEQGGVVVVIFKNSSRGWPRTNEDVAQQAQDLLNVTGGPSKYGIA